MQISRFSGILLFSSIILQGVLYTNVYAAACSYNEAILALKSGNEIRGVALLNMAARDGDLRAVEYLAARQKEKSSTMLVSREFDSAK